MVVLHKPGKHNYILAKAYHPIALLNMTGKLLMVVIADQLYCLLERYQLLPSTHFGEWPGRSMTDSLHLLEYTVKHVWWNKRVVSILFLDIEGAFPNMVTNQLLHNMCKWCVPEHLVTFTEQLLWGRRTRLSFDGHLSNWIPITNGIGQGDPLSMVLYIIYNSDLVEMAKGKSELTLAFVDDTAFIAMGPNFEDMHKTLQNMLK